MPLLTERDTCEFGSYKHVAPPEQEPSITIEEDFSGKAGPTIRVQNPSRILHGDH